MIIRSARQKRFFVVSYDLIETKNLGMKAKGLLIYILSRPDNWNVNELQLAKLSGEDGRTAIRSALAEIEQAGYLVRTRGKDENGQWVYKSYVYDEPQCVQKPMSENPTLENRTVINTVVTKKDTSSKEEVSKNILASAENEQGGGEQAKWFEAVCWVIGWDHHIITKDQAAQVGQFIKVVKKAGYTLADIREWYLSFWLNDWRYRKDKRRPSLKEMRASLSQGKENNVPPPALDGAEPQPVEVPEEMRGYFA